MKPQNCATNENRADPDFGVKRKHPVCLSLFHLKPGTVLKVFGIVHLSSNEASFTLV